MIILRASVVAVLCLATFDSAGVLADPGDCLTSEETRLLELINEYRGQNGLVPVPYSRSLTMVGQWHAWDYPTNGPFLPPCNLHSWSDAMPSLWEPVCYTNDHSQAPLMWSKPREITGNVYVGYGFELAAIGYTSAEAAFNAWKNSPPHNEILLNLGPWASHGPWPAMGAGVDSITNYYVVWFGSMSDPLGTVEPCAATGVPGRLDIDTTPLTISKSQAVPGDLEMTWGSSTCWPGPSDYSVHAGILGDFTSHDAIVCDTDGALHHATITPGNGNEYYLVVPITGVAEGSYGLDSSGAERPPSVSGCHTVQNLTECVPIVP